MSMGQLRSLLGPASQVSALYQRPYHAQTHQTSHRAHWVSNPTMSDLQANGRAWRLP
jgi:hypothetical protein